MKTLNELIDQHTDNDQLDFDAILQEMVEEMGGAMPSINGEQAIMLLDMHVQWALTYVAGLAYEALKAAGVLDGTFIESMENFELACQFDRMRRLYAIKEAQSTKRIEVPGQTSIPISGE